MKIKGLEILRGRKEFVKFASTIRNLIEEEAEQNNMLPRNTESIISEMICGSCFLALKDEELFGYVAVAPWDELELTEIMSLITVPQYRRKGVGTALAEKAFELAKVLYPNYKIIALANQNSRGIFQKQGLIQIPKLSLPEQLWSVCPECKDFVNFPDCHCTGFIEK